MLTEAAISLTNVQRWAQEYVLDVARIRSGVGASVAPPDARERAKVVQYEVSVVDQFVQLGAQSFALQGTEALWERTFPTGKRGRPPAVDVALFNARRREESRLEFGFYSRSKLRADAEKLGADLPITGDLIVTNYLLLWRMLAVPNRGRNNSWRDECEEAALRASTSTYTVGLRVWSRQDLFVPEPGRSRLLEVAILSVERRAHETATNAGETSVPARG